jgi:hypothetical protein
MSSTRPPQQYVNNLFVNRVDEIDFVRRKLEQVLEGQILEKRTTIFTGEHGMGKSWLLHHLRENLASPQVVTHYFNLENYFKQPDLGQAAQQLCAELWQALFKTTMPACSSLEQATRVLITAVKEQILPQQALVFLIDTVYEAPRAFLSDLDDYVLSAFAIEPKVLLVLAGRGREYSFRAPELRLRADFITLLPFNQTITQEQLQRQLPGKAKETAHVYAITFGNPKANGLLAASDNSPAALSLLIDEMLVPIELGNRSLIRTYLEAFAIPQRFDYSHVPHLLCAYHDDSTYKKLARREVRDIFDLLLDPGLIFWNTTRLAYTVHDSTRNILLQYLKAAQLDRCRRLHLACVDLYQVWVASGLRNAEQWQAELEYHKNVLRSLDSDGISGNNLD